MSNYIFNPQSDRPPQSVELDCLESPQSDRFLLKLGTYIADGINHNYRQHYSDEIAIREIIDYDAVNIDISQFPLLKLYRQTDNYSQEDVGMTKGIIAYCLTYPEQDRLPGLMKYMSKAINLMLDAYYLAHEECQSNVILEERSAEYRIQVNEVTNAIYPFLRFNFSFKER